MLFYVTAGLVAGLIAGAFYFGGEYLVTWALGWPLFLFNPEMWLAIAIALATGFGVLSLFDRSSIAISTPNRLPALSGRQFGTFLATLGIAELISRVAAGGFFVLHMFLYPTLEGEPALSPDALSTYYWEGMEVLAVRWSSPHISLVTRVLPDIKAVASGETVIAYSLMEVGDVQFFGGVAFAILFAFITALPIAYMTVRSGWRGYDHYAGE